MIPYHRPMIKYRDSHILTNGPYVRALEQSIKEMYDVEYAIACSSASIGLLISLHTSHMMSIVLPSFTWKSIKDILDILLMNYRYLDINPKTWHIDDFNIPNSLNHHTFGSVCESKTEKVIYDGAHALGSKIKDFGLATVFSLAPTKLVTSMEGGMILTNNQDIAGDILILRDRISRMSEVNADYGLYTLSMLDDVLEWKKMCYDYYKHHLPGIFQEIPISSNYNTIGMLTDLKIPPHIECRKYYEPLSFEPHLKATKLVYNKIVCLPSWFGVDYEKITNDIMDYNESLNNGRIRVFGESNSQVPNQS